jgi:hypothetical protein
MAASRLRRNTGLPFQEIEGRVVVVAPARRETHQLDELGSFLWAQLSRPRSIEDLVETVCGDYDVDAELAGRDVRAFVAELEEKGLVTRA